MNKAWVPVDSEFMRLVPGWKESYVVSTTPCFSDLIWDADMSLEEVKTLDSAVIIDAIKGPRRLVVQRIRGELRYWLATHRDPMPMTNLGEGELGTVPSLKEVATLCDEFLVKELPIKDLGTVRSTGEGLTIKKGHAE